MKVSDVAADERPTAYWPQACLTPHLPGLQAGTAAAVLLVAFCCAATASAASYNITWVLSGLSACNYCKCGCYRLT